MGDIIKSDDFKKVLVVGEIYEIRKLYNFYLGIPSFRSCICRYLGHKKSYSPFSHFYQFEYLMGDYGPWPNNKMAIADWLMIDFEIYNV